MAAGAACKALAVGGGDFRGIGNIQLQRIVSGDETVVEIASKDRFPGGLQTDDHRPVLGRKD